MKSETQVKHLRKLLQKIMMINQVILEFHNIHILKIVNKDIKQTLERIEQP